MSMQEASAAHKQRSQGALGDRFSVLTDEIARTRASGLADHALKTGQAAPDFTLPDAFGHEVSLDTLLQKGPVILSFYRGEWCPFCNIELHGYQELMPRIEALGATLVAISPEKPDGGIVATDKHKLTFPVLSDGGNVVARAYGVLYQYSDEIKALTLNVFRKDLATRNVDGKWEFPMPGTFVIDSAHQVRFAHVDPDYMVGRADPQEVLAVLEKLHHAPKV